MKSGLDGHIIFISSKCIFCEFYFIDNETNIKKFRRALRRKAYCNFSRKQTGFSFVFRAVPNPAAWGIPVLRRRGETISLGLEERIWKESKKGMWRLNIQ